MELKLKQKGTSNKQWLSDFHIWGNEIDKAKNITDCIKYTQATKLYKAKMVSYNGTIIK